MINLAIEISFVGMGKIIVFASGSYIMSKNKIKAKWNASEHERLIRQQIFTLFQRCPIPDNELLMNLPLFISRINLSQILFIAELYKNILDVHGSIFEFGVRWGRNLALFSALRGIYEPFNHNRRIVGFDTFEGFPSVDVKDGTEPIISVGSYNVTPKYENYLEEVLDYHEKESPIAHIKKYELVKGDASVEISNYLSKYPETIIALAYFDFDIYEPTKSCLHAIKDRLAKGSIVAFDELNCRDYPGETLALIDVLGLNKFKIHHTLFSPTQSYIIYD